MTSEERSLLRTAAPDPKGQVAIKRAQQTWHLDRERLDMLARCGHLLPSGERMGPHLGGTFAVWQITAAGRAVAEPGGSGHPYARSLPWWQEAVSWLRPTSLRLAAERRASSFANT